MKTIMFLALFASAQAAAQEIPLWGSSSNDAVREHNERLQEERMEQLRETAEKRKEAFDRSIEEGKRKSAERAEQRDRDLRRRSGFDY